MKRKPKDRGSYAELAHAIMTLPKDPPSIDSNARIAELEARVMRLEAIGRKFVDHYPRGINSDLDEACSEMRAALANKEASNGSE